MFALFVWPICQGSWNCQLHSVWPRDLCRCGRICPVLCLLQWSILLVIWCRVLHSLSPWYFLRAEFYSCGSILLYTVSCGHICP